MRIGIDARELCGRTTGLGRYLAGLLGEWAVDDEAGRHAFVLYAPEQPAVAVDAARFQTRVIPGQGMVWEQFAMPRIAAADSLDAFLAPGYTVPLVLGVPIVVVIHDVSFVAHPEWFRAREGIRRRWLTRRAAGRARTIVTVSQFSRRELIDRLGVPEHRIQVILHGITARKPVDSVGPKSPRVLFVGSIFNRRHVPDLIRAFRSIANAHPDASLDIVGDNRSYPYEDLAGTIEAEGLADHVRWHAYVSEAELQRLYGRARAFAFLSEYEGFGFTPLEALTAGVPPVLLETPVARESCGGAAFYVPSSDIVSIAQTLERALFDEEARAACLAEAPAVLARYNWRRAARETLAVLVAAAREAEPHD